MHTQAYLNHSICLAGQRPATMSLIFLSLALCAAAGNAWADPSGGTLRGALQQALDGNPEIRSRVEAFYASTQDRREAFGAYLPSVDTSLAAGVASREADNRGRFSRNYAEISLTQLLFDGFRVKNRVARFDHLSRARYYELLEDIEAKSLDVADAYLAVQRFREMLSLAERNLDNHMQTFANVQRRAASGVGNAADLQQVQGRLALARSNLMTEQANLQAVTARYQRLVGSAPSPAQESVFAYQYQIPDSFDGMLRTSYANNPALFASFEGIRSAEAALGESKAYRFPTFELGARHGAYKNYNSFDTGVSGHGYGNESLLEVRMRYNLYRGGADLAAERAAHRRMNQAEDLRDKACVDLRQEATVAYYDVHNYTEQLNSLNMHKQAQNRVLQAYKEQFDIGRRSLLDVLDAENEFFQSERADVNGRYNLVQARFRTLRQMGYLFRTLAVDTQSIPTLEDIWEGNPTESASRYCTLSDEAYITPVKFGALSSATTTQQLDLSGDSLFDTGSAVIRDESLERLAPVLNTLKQQRFKRISVIGHIDAVGTDERNHQLSLARALAIRELLLKQGVNAEHIDAAGRVGPVPVVGDAALAGHNPNRSVELHLHP